MHIFGYALDKAIIEIDIKPASLRNKLSSQFPICANLY